MMSIISPFLLPFATVTIIFITKSCGTLRVIVLADWNTKAHLPDEDKRGFAVPYGGQESSNVKGWLF